MDLLNGQKTNCNKITSWCNTPTWIIDIGTLNHMRRNLKIHLFVVNDHEPKEHGDQNVGNIEEVVKDVIYEESQQDYMERIDYTKTFSPIVKMVIAHNLLVVVAVKDYEMDHMDVNNVFLHRKHGGGNLIIYGNDHVSINRFKDYLHIVLKWLTTLVDFSLSRKICFEYHREKCTFRSIINKGFHEAEPSFGSS
ncbi:hypothetical protein CR513_34328, partial [Mucuna pruriens]